MRKYNGIEKIGANRKKIGAEQGERQENGGREDRREQEENRRGTGRKTRE